MQDIEALFRAADGVISRQEAVRAGLSLRQIRYRVASGAWNELLPGTYTPAATTIGPFQRLRALAKWAGPDAFLCGGSAAYVYDVAPFSTLDVVTTRSIRHPDVHVHRRAVMDFPRRNRKGFPVVVPEEMVRCIAARAPSALDRVLDAALRSRMTTLDRVAAHAAACRRRRAPGTGRLEHAVETRRGRPSTESDLEQRFLDVLLEHGLPVPMTQQKIDLTTGVGRVDFVYPEQGVAIEVDGYQFHAELSAWSHDVTRSNALQIKGLRVLRYTHHDLVTRPASVAGEVAEAIGIP